MSEYRLIGRVDTSAFSEITELATNTLYAINPDEPQVNTSELLRALKNGELGIRSYCWVASDAVTRAAHSLGIMASRESTGFHFFTSFAPLNAMPDNDDLIMCMTWGQYDHCEYRYGSSQHANQPYFGSRNEVKSLLPFRYDNFSQQRVEERSVVHMPGTTPTSPHKWLKTTPQEIAAGKFAISESDGSGYPLRQWF